MLILEFSFLNHIMIARANAPVDDGKVDECRAACADLNGPDCTCLPGGYTPTPKEEIELEELNNEIDCLENCANETENGGSPDDIPDSSGGEFQCDKDGKNCVKVGEPGQNTPGSNLPGDNVPGTNIPNINNGIQCDQNGNNRVVVGNPRPVLKCDQNGNNCVVMESENPSEWQKDGYHTEIFNNPVPVLMPNTNFLQNRTMTIKDKVTEIVTSLITSLVPSPPLIVTQAAATVTFTKFEKPITTTLPPLVFQIPTTVYRTSKPEIIERTMPPQIIYQPPVTSTIHHQIEHPPSTLIISTTLPPVIRTSYDCYCTATDCSENIHKHPGASDCSCHATANDIDDDRSGHDYADLETSTRNCQCSIPSNSC